MKYRAHEHVHTPGSINDIFDASHYRQLLTKKVSINGQEMPYHHFSDSRDIALGLSTDGFAPFRCRKTTAWPLILYNYNLPPEIRFLKEFIMCLGVVPGPKKPKDFDSFLWLLVEELLELAAGVWAFDPLEAKLFVLWAYLIIIAGDIPAISMVMRIKGHNGYAPCRMCEITGVGVPHSRNRVLYVPLNRSNHPDVQSSATAIKKYQALQLPRRTHQVMMTQAREVQLAPTHAEAERLAKTYGIKGIPILSFLSSVSFPVSFPYDFMHLIWENVVKNLILLWTGEYKGVDTGRETYELDKRVWEAICDATAASGSMIPSAYGARPPNPSTERSMCTADSWSFWTQYIGPVLLHRKFSKAKYYKHFIKFVRMIRVCLQFELLAKDISDLRDGFASWVDEFEKCVLFPPACKCQC